jgi:hypothetical protein
MQEYSIPTAVGLTLWAMLGLLVAGYTFKAFKETAP